jgi:hypothetical protein
MPKLGLVVCLLEMLLTEDYPLQQGRHLVMQFDYNLITCCHDIDNFIFSLKGQLAGTGLGGTIDNGNECENP